MPNVNVQRRRPGLEPGPVPGGHQGAAGGGLRGGGQGGGAGLLAQTENTIYVYFQIDKSLR